MIDYALRAWVSAGAAALATNQSFFILAQAIPGLDDNIFMKFVEKGGGWAVLLVVLWVYRRDYKRLSEGETERVNQLIALHVQSAKTNQDVAVALSRNTEVLRVLSARVNGYEYEPGREDHSG